MKDPNEIWLAGVDGCSGGWTVVFTRPNGDLVPARVIPTFEQIAFAHERPEKIAVDVPIGLPEHSPSKGRFAESAARQKLGKRKSSVFRIPSRSAVYASVAREPADPRERFFHACQIARETSEDRKAFAKQGFYILDKVVEVDKFLCGHRDYIGRVFETHPELAFWRLNGEQPLSEPKKCKGRIHPPGLKLRRALLMRAGVPEETAHARPPPGAAEDDLIDALACAVIARRIQSNRAKPFPDPPPEPDSCGLPMAIWA